MSYRLLRRTHLHLSWMFSPVLIITDTMASVEGIVFDNPRWERTTLTFGVNYHMHSQLAFKSHYSLRRLAAQEKNRERTFAVGLGFQY